LANLNAAHGHQYVGDISKGPGRLQRFSAPATYATAIGWGDTILQMATSVTTNGKVVMDANQAAATDVFSGCSANYRAASVLGDVFVYVSPDAIFDVQASGTTGIAANDNGLNITSVTAAASAVTGLSAGTVDDTTQATTNTLGWKIIEIPTYGDNAAGVNARVLVRCNRHRYANQLAGV